MSDESSYGKVDENNQLTALSATYDPYAYSATETVRAVFSGPRHPVPHVSSIADSDNELIRGYTPEQWDILTDLVDQLPGELYGERGDFEETIIALAGLVSLVRINRHLADILAKVKAKPTLTNS